MSSTSSTSLRMGEVGPRAGYQALPNNSDEEPEGESRFSKRDLYERGHVAVCSHKQAICMTVFVFSSIFFTSVVIAFARPWNDCGLSPPGVEDVVAPVIPVATTGELFPWDNIRLPDFVKPISYDLELTPNMTTLVVRGIIKLIFQVTAETDFIVFHSYNISITSKTINEKLKVLRLLEYPDREQMYLQTEPQMRPGKTYSIRLKFQYNLAQTLEGFYLSTYKDREGNERRLATTHFEPTSARKAFPCFDEPHLKAKFLVTITHDRNLTSFFNMPEKETSDVRGKPDQIRKEFEETVEMSTYLVAFVVCDFVFIENKTDSNVKVRVIASDDKIDQAKFALEEATAVTQNFEKYFGIAYPLPKQDLIAIPDFGAGAMENWGLITYRETSLLYQEGVTSASAQQWIATVVAHELAHQWFGNLVTMQWWNDLWLNEGFASWMEFKGVAETQPTWRMMDQFWSTKTQLALDLDSLASSHPVSVPVHDPKEIEAIFDTISYKKGSAILQMLENFMGEDNLKAGLKLYLERHKFKNAVTKDLWDCLTEAANNTKDVESMMNTWTLQMGYPLITFSQEENSTVWNIRQQRFLLSAQVNGTNGSLVASPYNYTWVVPVDFVTDKGEEAHILLSAEVNKTDSKVSLSEEVTWIKANLQGSGYYRVNYPIQIWLGLIDQMNTNHSVFSPSDRAQLIDDAFTLCKAGLLSHEIPLNLSLYLKKETELVPWEVALTHLRQWRDFLREGPGRVAVNRYIQYLMANIYKKLGWQDTGEHVDRLLRTRVLEESVDAEDGAAIAEAGELYKQLIQNGKNVSANFQEIVFSAGVMLGGRTEWDWAYNRYTHTIVPSEKGVLIKAMATTRDTYILQEYLDMTLNKTQVRSQDVRSVIAAVAKNPTGAFLAWRHFQRHWHSYYNMFKSGSFVLGSLIKSVSQHFSTQFDYEQVRDFFADKEVGSGKLSLRQSLEKIQVNINFRLKHEENIIQWTRETVAATPQ